MPFQPDLHDNDCVVKVSDVVLTWNHMKSTEIRGNHRSTPVIFDIPRSWYVQYPVRGKDGSGHVDMMWLTRITAKETVALLSSNRHNFEFCVGLSQSNIVSRSRSRSHSAFCSLKAIALDGHLLWRCKGTQRGAVSVLSQHGVAQSA